MRRRVLDFRIFQFDQERSEELNRLRFADRRRRYRCPAIFEANGNAAFGSARARENYSASIVRRVFWLANQRTTVTGAVRPRVS